jgi:hypothetical protein
MKNALLFSYFFLFLLFAIFSFILADPNLFLLKGEWFVGFQTYLWQNLLPLQLGRTLIFAFLLGLLFLNYVLLIKNWPHLELNQRRHFWGFLLLLCLPLVFSYNAFSYDLFNYIFNAKMVVEFGANPHLRTALEFADEPMLRFMNNVHTPAPYGYGWTALSLLPYVLGTGKFLITFFSFKFFALLSLLLGLLISEKLFSKVNYRQLALFFFNPLVLIEILSSAHNDLWMLSPALLAIYLASNFEKNKAWKIFLIILFLAISISIKFATVILLPFVLYLLFRKKLPKLPYFYDLASFAMFIPLLTERSKQFLPWYLLWSLIFIPFVRHSWWRQLLIVFSLSALLRYLPWLYYLPWMSFHLDTSNLLLYQKAITWLIPSFFLLSKGLIFLFNRSREK